MEIFHSISSIPGLAWVLFTIWMLIDAFRRGEWLWVLLMVFIPPMVIWYFFGVFRDGPSSTRGFELPGAHSRKRIRELQAQIHHLDKPHHYSQLGDIYFQQGKLDKAEACYRASLERDPADADTRAHYGQCLIRLKRPQEAKPLLEGVVAENARHDYGHSMMALAETQTALEAKDEAIATWKRVTENYSYPRAKVQLAELYWERGEIELARHELEEVLADDPHAPAFQRRKDRGWIRRARRVLASVVSPK